jgi:hypothetical protein
LVCFDPYDFILDGISPFNQGLLPYLNGSAGDPEKENTFILDGVQGKI